MTEQTEINNKILQLRKLSSKISKLSSKRADIRESILRFVKKNQNHKENLNLDSLLKIKDEMDLLNTIPVKEKTIKDISQIIIIATLRYFDTKVGTDFVFSLNEIRLAFLEALKVVLETLATEQRKVLQE